MIKIANNAVKDNAGNWSSGVELNPTITFNNIYKCSAGTYLPENSTSYVTCPANSYCEGSSGTYDGKEHGKITCSSLDSGSYTTSNAGSSAASSCYIPKANLSGKYVATAKAAPVTCTKGYYCPGTTNINYGSTGGRTACGGGKYNDSTGSSSSSACKNISANCYGTNGTTTYADRDDSQECDGGW